MPDKKRDCKDCEHMKVKFHLVLGSFLYDRGVAKCTAENGVIKKNLPNKEFNIGVVGSNYTDWKVWGAICKSFKTMDDPEFFKNMEPLKIKGPITFKK